MGLGEGLERCLSTHTHIHAHIHTYTRARVDLCAVTHAYIARSTSFPLNHTHIHNTTRRTIAQVMSLMRFLGGATRNYASPKSAYRPLPPAPPTEDDEQASPLGGAAGGAVGGAASTPLAASVATASASVSDGDGLVATASELLESKEGRQQGAAQQQGQDVFSRPVVVTLGVAAAAASAAAGSAAGQA